MKKYFTLALMLLCTIAAVQGQSKQSIAVLSIDTKNFEYDEESMADLVRIELEKLNIYEVIDKYDLADFVKMNNIQICYGKTCLVEIGKKLKTDLLLTGNLEQLGNKIILSLRLIDIKNEEVKKTNVMEYVLMPEHIHTMVEISVKNIFGIENDPNLANMLANYDDPINNPQTRLELSGPRMGVAYILGDMGKRLQDPIDEGGWEASPFMTQFGYQFETQYMSAGSFQGLFEYLFIIGGLEQQMFNPSLVFMNGFRSNKSGWEVAFGPSVGIKKTAKGFYDTEGFIGDKGNWHLTCDWKSSFDNYYDIEEQMDKRGKLKLSSSFIFSIGKTFHSGYLNIPVNLYVAQKKSGTYLGASFGFNVNRNAKKNAK